MTCWNKYERSCKCDVLPAGTYYIGDPCYAIGEPDSYWQKLCKVMAEEQTYNSSAKWNKDKIKQRTGKKTIRDILLENYGLMVSNPSKKDKKFYDVAIYGTAYGDGSYKDIQSNDNVEYHVDAGIIGAIPVEAIPKNKKTHNDRDWVVAGGNFVTFSHKVHCFTDGDMLHFGNHLKHIAIDTNPDVREQERQELILEMIDKEEIDKWV